MQYRFKPKTQINKYRNLIFDLFDPCYICAPLDPHEAHKDWFQYLQ